MKTNWTRGCHTCWVVFTGIWTLVCGLVHISFWLVYVNWKVTQHCNFATFETLALAVFLILTLLWLYSAFLIFLAVWRKEKKYLLPWIALNILACSMYLFLMVSLVALSQLMVTNLSSAPSSLLYLCRHVILSTSILALVLVIGVVGEVTVWMFYNEEKKTDEDV